MVAPASGPALRRVGIDSRSPNFSTGASPRGMAKPRDVTSGVAIDAFAASPPAAASPRFTAASALSLLCARASRAGHASGRSRGELGKESAFRGRVVLSGVVLILARLSRRRVGTRSVRVSRAVLPLLRLKLWDVVDHVDL